MIFKHIKTERPALFIAPYDDSWQNQDDPYLYRIRRFEDLPFPQPTFYSDLSIPPEVWDLQGNRGFYHYLQAFFYDDATREKNKRKKRQLLELAKVHEKDFWFMFLPSGFPDGEIKWEFSP